MARCSASSASGSAPDSEPGSGRAIEHRRLSAPARFGLYAGGFLGPFGGAVIAVLIPQLREAFDASTATVTAGITVYLVPFAALQLVSGTLGERWGLRRTVRVAYLLYAAASLAAAFAPGVEAFLAARALQGVANAFLTPLLLSALAEDTPSEEVGRSVGTFAAVQTVALVAAPLAGGLAGELSWRLAFGLPALAALALSALSLPAPGAHREPPALRAALSPRVVRLGAVAFLGYLAIPSLAFVVALRAADAFGLGSSARGLVVAAFGVAGAVLGRWAGGLVDRRGRVPVAVAGAGLCAVSVAALGLAGSPAVLAALWSVAGVGSALLWAGVNTLTVEAAPANRAGATSIVSGLKFAGNALAPLLWLPLYAVAPELAFFGAGLACLVLLVLVSRLGAERPDPVPG